MILIISHSTDKSTDDIIDWLLHYKINFIRVNGFQIIWESIYEDGTFKMEGLQLDSIKIIWFRRWISFSEFKKVGLSIKSSHPLASLNQYFKKEINSIRDSFLLSIKEQKFINGFSLSEPNKMEVLREAQKVGLQTPDTIITSRKQELTSFMDKHDNIITKPIEGVLMFSLEEEHYSSYTTEVNHANLSKISDNFFPTLFQEMIPKEYEIRIFHLDGINYSMAIFSQNDETTRVDFRRYNFDKPNRVVPYKLPPKIDLKVNNLMSKLKYNTGSIDMIKSTNGKWVFLEVNPSGQFGMVSFPCNYNLEEIFANYLISYCNEK